MDQLVTSNFAPTAHFRGGMKVPATVNAAFAPPCSLSVARRYTRQLALGHYENFSVISLLLPRHLRQDFSNVYAFCRTADDLGDEVPDKNVASEYLERFKELTRACYEGRALSPLFVALSETIGRFDIPIEPFLDLIDAFEQDQRVNRYETFEQVVDYCRRSADPVGRLVLYMCGYRDAERQRLSDRTCTALQLANFWQDVTVDLRKDRVYLPLDLLETHGYPLEALLARQFDGRFRAAMQEAVNVTRELFLKGLPLADSVDRRLAIDLDLFSRGGLRVLEKIEAQDYDVLSSRPVISKVERVGLLLGAVTRRAFSRSAGSYAA